MNKLQLSVAFEGFKPMISGIDRIEFKILEGEAEKITKLLSLKGKALVMTLDEDNQRNVV